MKDSQILSTFESGNLPAEQSTVVASSSLLFDVCHVGVVLRAVLFVQAVVAVAALFGANAPLQWLSRMALITAGALPATLAWLLASCALKRLLARLPPYAQQLSALFLGALAGGYGCAMLVFMGMLEPAPWWASGASGALLAGILTSVLVLRGKARTPATATARLSELQARIRPHFLFNTLNSAIALVRAEPRKAENLLEDLSDLFRHALMEQSESVSLAQEVELAQRYLAIEQVRFAERIRVQWAIDEQANPARLPPLLLQPLVENAVHHGVEPSPDGAEIKISTERRGSRVVIKVSNTVPCPRISSGNGLALKNVRERLNLLHDVQASFQSGLKNGVFQVRIEIPLEVSLS